MVAKFSPSIGAERSDPLYDRRAKVTIGTRSVESFYPIGATTTSGARTSTTREGLRIAFKVKQALSSKNNDAEVTIYNLSDDTRADIARVRRPVLDIEAGYSSSIGTIFAGYAEQIESKFDNPGVSTKISALDGAKEGKSVVNIILSPRSTVVEAVRQFGRAMNVSTDRAVRTITAGGMDRKIAAFFNGYTISGTAKQEFDKLCRSLGIGWTIMNRQLMIFAIARDGEVVAFEYEDQNLEESFDLNVDSGLIGSPELARDAKRPRLFLLKVRSLLQPGVRPGRRINLWSREYKGTFRVEIAEHEGDTYGAAWYTDALLVEVKKR